MRLIGHIMNTSGGKLNVMDGFGRINIDNQTAHDLVLRDLSTARAADSIGIEGKIHITDSAKTGAGKQVGLDANNNPLFSFDLDTIITRVGNTITVTDSTTRNLRVCAPTYRRWLSVGAAPSSKRRLVPAGSDDPPTKALSIAE